MSILVIDVGTSGVRAAIVNPDSSVSDICYRALPPNSPAPGLVEFDPAAMAEAALDVARQALARGGPVQGVGIANQRASTVVWERSTGIPVGPGLGWQDLRTVGTCLELQGLGLRLAPNASATKVAALMDQADPKRTKDLCFGTVDSWLVWTLTGGSHHVTDASNAAVTGLVRADCTEWAPHVLEALRIPEASLPRIVDSSGLVAEASALPGSPPIAGIAGDQQASLMGQGCTRAGSAKATFGTGGMLDACVGADRPTFEVRGRAGTFPIVAWRLGGEVTWGIEAIMLSAGSAVDWLRDDLGLIATSPESDSMAASVESTGDVWFVPALMGLGTPVWDFGARGTLLGLTRGTGRAEITRAVLEGVAQRGVDLLEAAETDGEISIGSLRIDGGMSANATFVQALANAAQRPIEISPVLEATTLGAAYLAGLALGTWANTDDVAAAWQPRSVVEPIGPDRRQRWLEARQRSEKTIPELSALDF